MNYFKTNPGKNPDRHVAIGGEYCDWGAHPLSLGQEYELSGTEKVCLYCLGDRDEIDPETPSEEIDTFPGDEGEVNET